MKKIFIVWMLAMAVLIPAVNAAVTTNVLYTVTASTFAITDAAKLADINLASVKIKSIVIAQTAAVAQNVTLYKNANSTNTITAVATYAIPGTVGNYVLEPFSASTSLNSVDAIDVPYFSIRSSTSTSASSCIANVVYWK